MLKAYKYRIYPTKMQITLIEKHFGSARFLYNYFLDYRQKEYAKGNKKVNYNVTQTELTKLKKQEDFLWLNECASQALQMSLRNLDGAFGRFFKKLGAYPKFHSKRNTHQSFTVPQNIKVATNNLHKISNKISNQYDIICLETLHVKDMIKNRKLAKGIADVAWSEFMRQLEYKSNWRGKTVIKIDKWFPSSQICVVCGSNTGKKTLNIRKFDCPECKAKNIDRDINASINIRNYGIGQLDKRNTAGTVEIQACGVSSDGVVVYNTATSHDMLKQEAQSSLGGG